MASSCIFLPLGLLVLSLLCAANADVYVWGLRGYGVQGDAFGNAPDPFVKVYCGSTFGGMTEFIKDNANPSWSADFSFRNGKVGDTLKLEVWDKDMNYDDHLGNCVTTVKAGSYKVSCNFGKGVLEYHYSL
ncbi:perforin-1-like [Alosa sapidissima]|uniref:perforin-1-like n=1 Tax=Alosa sapidissima TaxID=34773 RepID=UPI001C09FC02|nr:perforin-1-like [Alosa sapidissima]